MLRQKLLVLSTRITLDQILDLRQKFLLFQSEIYLRKQAAEINGKSILSLAWFFSHLRPGESFHIVAHGTDADRVISCSEKMFPVPKLALEAM
ncbi:HPr family phosphocarrier protein [Melghirimyces thermohalophilus]|uniref:HPr family phosphocarrier protein n=1 Tax=Melghirimyces thermohalophilus TaxID=1236220 RepID=UPI000B8854EA|nr:HPr family phosphocarrier protein [Melghirimyces thermohalophilus]